MPSSEKDSQLPHKLVLGTAQFGLDYGLQNTVGQVSFLEVTKIIDYAASVGISMLDTANMYGESQQVLGKYLAETEHSFRLISKVKAPDLAEAQAIFANCLSTLGVSQLYGYLVHHFEEYQANPALYNFLLEQKSLGKIQKVGFSLYFPHQLEYLFDHNVPVDLVQVPLSIIDQRFKPFLAELAARKIEVHVRSVFLQGVLTKEPSGLPPFFDVLKPTLQQLHQLAQDHHIPIATLALNFAQLQPEVDGVVIGVHNQAQLAANVVASRWQAQTQTLLSELAKYHYPDEQLTVPLHWPT